MPFKAKNNRQAVVVCAIHVVKRPSKRSVLVLLIFRCDKCPSKENLKEYLYDSLDFDSDSEIIFQQWVGADRTTFLSDSASIHELIDMVVNSIDKLTSHTYIAKAQSNYLKSRKENIDENSIIFWATSQKNSTFVVQDQIQGYHWYKEQATLHPVLMYFKGNGTVSSGGSRGGVWGVCIPPNSLVKLFIWSFHKLCRVNKVHL